MTIEQKVPCRANVKQVPRGEAMLGYWNAGILECWDTGMLGYWNAGMKGLGDERMRER
jgi:hypothetical protein